MALLYKDEYFLRVTFGGDTDVAFEPGNVQEFIISESLDSLVPTLSFTINNPRSILNYFVPPDNRLNKISVQLANDIEGGSYNGYEFKLFRSFPDNEVYRVEAFLDVPNLFSPLRARGFKGSMKTAIEEVVKKELEIEKMEVSPSLDYAKKLVQPHWSNAKFFRYLRDNLVGKTGEACYYCFIKNVEEKPTFVFKTLDDFLLEEVKYTFVLGDFPFKEAKPIYEYKIINNYKMIESLGGKKQTYSYFNYDTSEFVLDRVVMNDCSSLADYFMVDKEDGTGEASGQEDGSAVDVEDDINLFELGRNSLFTTDFKGKITKGYFDRLGQLVQMWITTEGLSDISPGHKVRLFFMTEVQTDETFSFPYNGYWMVRKVLHSFGFKFYTRLLLTRCGIDAPAKTSLVAAQRVVRHGDGSESNVEIVRSESVSGEGVAIG